MSMLFGGLTRHYLHVVIKKYATLAGLHEEMVHCHTVRHSEHALTINLENVGPEDGKKLSEIENPAEAIERQINVLIACNSLADKLKVKRDNYLVHIYSTS